MSKDLNVCGKSFGGDVEFLRNHVETVVLEDSQGGRVAVVPAFQGRVMTSSLAGGEGRSFGWINEELIASGEVQTGVNAYGGEERFWLGPEGGQYSIFFKPGASFDFENWQTPPIIDTEPFELVEASSEQARFRRTGSVINWTGTTFDLDIDRTVSLLDRNAVKTLLPGVSLAGLDMVAYQSDNTLVNAGEAVWSEESGLLSIWILGIFKPSPDAVIVVPFKAGSEEQLGSKVNDAYFGAISSDRLKIDDDVMLFRGDGESRGKIGVSAKRAKPFLGSYSASDEVLTIVNYDKPEGAVDYVNSMWEHQDAPYAGDVVNAYNDGPAFPGADPFGPFYELESSSPAAKLAPGQSINHVHRTIHLSGDEAGLDAVARSILGIGLDRLTAFAGA